jgi:hypothetical protein
MKQAAKLFDVAVVAVSLSVLVSTTSLANSHGGFGGSLHGGGHGGGHYGGYHGGDGHYYWHGGWGGYPWFSFAYGWPYYYYGYYSPCDYYYYDYPPPVYYSPPAVYSAPPPAPATANSPQPVDDRPLSPTAVDRDSPPPPPRAQRPPPIQRSDQGQSIGVADVKALVSAGLSDDVILSHIRNSQAVYHLTTAEIIDLKNSGVSEKVIDFMINTPTVYRSSRPPPPSSPTY